MSAFLGLFVVCFVVTTVIDAVKTVWSGAFSLVLSLLLRLEMDTGLVSATVLSVFLFGMATWLFRF